LARNLEAKSDLVVRILGQTGKERFSILKMNWAPSFTEQVVLDAPSFAQVLRTANLTNGSVILVVPAVGFTPPGTNVTRIFRTNGFSSIQIFADRWGRRFKVPTENESDPEKER